MNNRIASDQINTLKPGEIFVFGSNLEGLHMGGAARIAFDRFGAIWGEGVGLHGDSYAIPTMHGGIDAIKPYIDEFINFARNNPKLIFLLTRIGCGIAGFRDEEIAPLFLEGVMVENIKFPKKWWDLLNKDLNK